MAVEELHYERTEVGAFRVEVVDRLKRGLPITLATKHLGDTMISWWTHTQALMQLCQEEHIPMTPERLPLELPHNRPNPYYLFLMASTQYPLKSALQGRYQVASELAILSHALGLEKLDPALFHEPPLPLPTTSGPLQNFDPQTLSWRASQLQREHGTSKELLLSFRGEVMHGSILAITK